MSYTPTQWNTGDTITASALNKIEQGIADAGASIIITDTNGTLDKTFAEIANYVASGVPCYIKYGELPANMDTEYAWDVYLVRVERVSKYDAMYRVYALNNTKMAVSSVSMVGTPEVWSYSATASSGYPTFFRKTYVPSNYASLTTTRGD